MTLVELDRSEKYHRFSINGRKLPIGAKRGELTSVEAAELIVSALIQMGIDPIKLVVGALENE